jgi:glycosyltransferase involved in cell wall biosynthesis
VRTRILHVHNYSNWGGNLEHVRLVLQGLDRRRFEPCLAAPPGEDYLSRFKELDVRLFPFEARSRFDGSAVLALARLVRKQRIHVIHSHLRRTDWICCLARPLCPGRKWITTVHGEINRADDFTRAGGLRSWVYGWLLARGFHKVLTVSRELADQLVFEESVPRKKLRHLPNGIRIDRFQPVMPEVRRRNKKNLGVPPDSRVVIQMGRFGRRKGQRVLLRALADNAGKGRPWVCFFLGDGDDQAGCRRLAQSLGLGHQVHFWGFQADIVKYLGAADVVAMPSFSEGLPRGLLEGMAMGLCPVASDIGGVREALQTPRFGLTFPAGDHRILAETLDHLWQHPDYLRHLGMNARQRIESAYTADLLLKEQTACYTALLHQERS